MHDIRAFTMGDANYFLGVVALLNSLRISGNTMPLTVLDVGLEEWQRSLLSRHATVVTGRPDVRPHLLKVDAPLASDADIVVMLDSDLVVTAPLTAMTDAARAGKVCAYGDQEAESRWFPEWKEIFGLRASLRRDMYVNSGAVAVSKRRLPSFLPRWAELCDRIADKPMMGQSALAEADPLWLADQEALNALLLSEVAADQVARYTMPGMVLGTENMARTKVVDLGRLRCSFRGEPVTMLHAVGGIKPWQRRAAREYRRTAYTACLRRALTGRDIEVRVPPDRVPLWLRPGAPSAALSQLLHAYHLGARTTRPLRRHIGLSPGRPPEWPSASPP